MAVVTTPTGERVGRRQWLGLVLGFAGLVLVVHDRLGGSSLLYLLIQRGAATQVTSLLYLVPPCTAAMAWLMFRESLGLHVLAGLALTAAGIALVVRRAPERASLAGA